MSVALVASGKVYLYAIREIPQKSARIRGQTLDKRQVACHTGVKQRVKCPASGLVSCFAQGSPLLKKSGGGEDG